MDGNLLSNAVSWIDAFTKEYASFAKANPAKVPAILCKAPSSMKSASGLFSYYKQGRITI